VFETERVQKSKSESSAFSQNRKTVFQVSRSVTDQENNNSNNDGEGYPPIDDLHPEQFDKLRQRLEKELSGSDKTVEQKLDDIRQKQSKHVLRNMHFRWHPLKLLERECWGMCCLVSKRFRKHVRESKGMLTAKGELFDYHEWHSLIMGFLLVSLGYLVSPVFLLGVVQVFKRLGEDASGSLSEIFSELPYFLGGCFVSALVLDLGLGLSLSISGLKELFAVFVGL